MNKHIFGYGSLLICVIVLTGQLSIRKKEVATDSKPSVTAKRPESNTNKIEMGELKLELEEKEKDIARLNELLSLKKKAEEKDTQSLLSSEIDAETVTSHSHELTEMFKEVLGEEQYTKARKKYLKKAYADFFHLLEFNENEEEELINLLAERRALQSGTFIEIANGNGSDSLITTNNKELLAGWGPQGKSGDDTQLKEFLGEDYAKLERFEKTVDDRNTVNTIAAGLDERDFFEEEQKERLIDLFYERRQEKGNDEDYLSRASDFLNENQLNEVRKRFLREKVSPTPLAEKFEYLEVEKN